MRNPPHLENLMVRRLLLVPLLLTLAAAAATAQDVRQYRVGDAVDPREVAAILGQPSPAVPAVKMRSIRLLDEAPPQAQQLASLASTETATAADFSAGPSKQEAALSLPVQFAFDSADILSNARQQLDALAEGIRLLPGMKSVVIEGHTDAVGSEQYNEQLSQRRANAVKRYLVAVHGIEPARLRAVGMGQYRPLPGSDPYAAENRRVQFRGE
jgi:outer membrane protein OmpA-like peptidoglycan-associated protein